MLNLPIAMLKFALALFILFQFQETAPVITSPQAGDTLRGKVEISGSMDVPGFASAELAFSYAASSPAEAWFTIQNFTQPPADPVLAVWDTSLVTDGDYTLRLRVFLLDGTFQDVFVGDLKIRNDTPDPTATPTDTPTPTPTLPFFSPSNPLPLGVETSTPMPSLPTSTPLPPNPAALSAASILSVFGKSALAILGVSILVALLLRLRRN